MAYGDPLPQGIWANPRNGSIAEVYWPLLRGLQEMAAKERLVFAVVNGRYVTYPLPMFLARYRHLHGPHLDTDDFDH